MEDPGHVLAAAVDLILYPHVEGGSERAFFLVAAIVHVVVGFMKSLRNAAAAVKLIIIGRLNITRLYHFVISFPPVPKVEGIYSTRE